MNVHTWLADHDETLLWALLAWIWAGYHSSWTTEMPPGHIHKLVKTLRKKQPLELEAIARVEDIPTQLPLSGTFCSLTHLPTLITTPLSRQCCLIFSCPWVWHTHTSTAIPSPLLQGNDFCHLPITHLRSIAEWWLTRTQRTSSRVVTLPQDHCLPVDKNIKSGTYSKCHDALFLA